MSQYTIRDIADEFGLSLRTLRFWEAERILAPVRRKSLRFYSAADRERVANVVLWSTAGFSLREIGSMLQMTQVARAQVLAARLPELKSEADRTYARQCEAIAIATQDLPSACNVQPSVHTDAIVGTLKQAPMTGSDVHSRL